MIRPTAIRKLSNKQPRFAPPIQRVAEQYLRPEAATAAIEVGRVGSSLKAIEQRLAGIRLEPPEPLVPPSRPEPICCEYV